MTLATLDEAKIQVGVTDPARDAEVTMYLEQASAIVFDYLGTRADPAWDETSAPDLVRAATLKRLGHLYEHRGDDANEDHDTKAHDAMVRLLMNLRDSGLA